MVQTIETKGNIVTTSNNWLSEKKIISGYLWKPQKTSRGNFFLHVTFFLLGDFYLHGTYSEKFYVDSYLCFQMALLYSMFYFFFLYWSLSLSLCMVFFYGSLSQPICRCKYLWRLKHSSKWIVDLFWYSHNLVLILVLNSKYLIQMVNFQTRIPDCESHSAALKELFLFLTLLFVLQCLPSTGNFWLRFCLSFY